MVQVKRVTRSGRGVVAGAVLLWAVLAPGAFAQEQRRPNIVFILADDLGYGDLGAFGQKKIRTPNIDKLAAEGIKLTTHYAGNAVCAPSRAVLMSGKHPGRAEIRANGKPENYRVGTVDEGQVPVSAGELKLPLTLKALGYTNGGFGKWGLGPLSSEGSPLKQGFDRFSGYICQTVAHNFYPAYVWENEKQVFLDNPPPQLKAVLKEGADPSKPESYAEFQGRQFAPDLYTESALKFIADNKARPFFLYYPTIVPHLGYQVPEDSFREYDGTFEEDGIYPGGGDYVPVLKPRTTYAAMVTRLDREVGRIVKQVQDLGLDENTIFVFTSDNGSPAGNPNEFFNSGGKFRGSKGTLYEGGVREPLIVRWKGKIAAGGESDRVTGFEDWLATLLELAGAKSSVPAGLDGVSFAPTLLGETQPERPLLYREYTAGGGAQLVREGKWKLLRQAVRSGGGGELVARGPRGDGEDGGGRAGGRVRRPPGATEPANASARGEYELFDLEADPSEQVDLAAKHPEIVERLKVQLEKLHEKNERFPLGLAGEKVAGPR